MCEYRAASFCLPTDDRSNVLPASPCQPLATALVRMHDTHVRCVFTVAANEANSTATAAGAGGAAGASDDSSGSTASPPTRSKTYRMLNTHAALLRPFTAPDVQEVGEVVSEESDGEGGTIINLNKAGGECTNIVALQSLPRGARALAAAPTVAAAEAAPEGAASSAPPPPPPAVAFGGPGTCVAVVSVTQEKVKPKLYQLSKV